MDPLAKYSFLPWMRQGISNKITNAENDISVKNRSSFTLQLELEIEDTKGIKTKETLPPQKIGLYGPGDVQGLDTNAIIKVWPRNWITNFEPNYFPYIEFYDEDLPWRYTPSAPDNQRLKPWLTLVVLKEGVEFSEPKNMQGKPLPYFTLGTPDNTGVNAQQVFPDFAQLWAWAHIHVNSDLSDGMPGETVPDAETAAARLENLLKQNADRAYSRIICPRRLEPNTSYHAFLIPTFESGRMAGLGLEANANLPANTCSWANAATKDFPFYHRWYFRTGAMGDFEYLVTLLKPKPADTRVGVREMGVPGQPNGLPAITVPEPILRLGGALRVPIAIKEEDKAAHEAKFDNWHNNFSHPFIGEMAAHINLEDDYKNAGAGANSDPVVTMPLYGRWHAATQRLLKKLDGSPVNHTTNWVHRLNLDPRYRVPAGYGTSVVQKNQEDYMQAAWEQVGDITEANRRIFLAQIAMEASFFFHAKHLLKLPLAGSWLITTPLHKRIMTDAGTTVLGKLMQSPVPYAVTTGTFRSMIRPRGRIMKRLALGDAEKQAGITPTNLLERINEGEVNPAPPKKAPTGAPNLDGVIAALPVPKPLPAWAAVFKKLPWLLWLLLLIALMFLLLAFMSGPFLKSVFIFAGLACIYLFWFLGKKLKEPDSTPVELLGEAAQTPEKVDEMPLSPDFVLTENINLPSPANTKGTTDSTDAARFKAALKDVFRLIQVNYPEPVRVKLELPKLNTFVLEQLHPSKTIPARTLATIMLPPHILANLTQSFGPVMKYPVIDVPMYKPLSDISTDMFLPNIGLIENNSLTLLENNQPFIEAYMVGLNHEFARELLWREYPTDQRGSSFRQFWDLSSFYPSKMAANTSEEIKEKLRDIPPIHKWSLTNSLGDHNQREQDGDKAQIVLVVRGELLKKYPTAVIYAQKADWDSTNGQPDFNKERLLAEISSSEAANPPETKVKTPLFQAKVEPDIYFLGFDLTAEQAKGSKTPGGDAGWFFVIKERPGEPQFGFDEPPAGLNPPRLVNWKSLHWGHVGTAAGAHVMLNNTIELLSYQPADQENKAVLEDKQAVWDVKTPGGPQSDAAQLAYILYQAPVQVAVHASRMLQ